MKRRRSCKTARQNTLGNHLSGYRAKYGIILIIALFALSKSEYDEKHHSPQRRPFLENDVGRLNDKSKAAPNLYKRFRRTTKSHISQTRVWQHKCDRKPSGPWSTHLPVIFYCIPFSFLNATGAQSVNETISSEKHSILPTRSVDNFTTIRTPRNLDRGLANASLQFDVPSDVTDLRLWFQGIVSVEDDAFIGLDRLKLLGLQHNEISYLSRDAFAGEMTR